MTWGWELIVDAKECDKTKFTYENIHEFTKELVYRIKMKAYGPVMIEHFATHDETKAGFSMAQFIETSNICAHFVDLNGDAYFNIFSCMEFDRNDALMCIDDYFKPYKVTCSMIERG